MPIRIAELQGEEGVKGIRASECPNGEESTSKNRYRKFARAVRKVRLRPPIERVYVKLQFVNLDKKGGTARAG